MSKINGVIFDFNGTLFWDTKLHDKAWDIFLDRKGKVLSDKEKVTVIHGKNNREIMQSIFEKLDDEEIQQLSIEKESIYQKLCLSSKMKLADGAVEFIKWLKVNSVPYTIATSSGKENVDFYFNNYELGRWFAKDKVVYSDGTIKSKPDPDIFIRAMETLQIQSNETLIFEDSPAGIRSAENARAGKIIIVNSTNSDYSGFTHQVITSFNQVNMENLI
ncbi:MAG TPA: HAD family phosphatase [Lentimicrobium sp.]|nr:HAD family phosphatase [Lentimicrobium sp.]